MFDNKGQAIDTSAVWVIVTMLVAIAMGGLMFSKISTVTSDEVEDTGATHTFAVNDSTFDENIENSAVTPWTTASSSNSEIAWDGTNNWINVQDTPPDNTGLEYTDNVTQSVSVTTHDEIDSATVTGAAQVATNDNLTDADIYIKLVDPSSNTDTIWQKTNAQGTTGTWWTTENDISNLIDEDGDYKLRLEVHMKTDDNDATHEINADNLDLSVTSQEDSIGEEVQEETDDGASTVFPLLVLMVIVGVFVILIGVLRAL